jgi:hypothetical protein
LLQPLNRGKKRRIVSALDFMIVPQYKDYFTCICPVRGSVASLSLE